MKLCCVARSMWSTCVPSMRRNSDERQSVLAGTFSDTNIAMCVASRGIVCRSSVALCVK